MRRTFSVLLPAVTAAAVTAATLAGCGSAAPADPNKSVSVSGSFEHTPKVHIPAVKAGGRLTLTTSIRGHGAALPAGDSFLGDIALYKWSGAKHALIDSTYRQGPQVLPAQPGLPGLNKALQNLRVGSRVLAVVPPKDGYGPQGNSQLGIGATDTTVWVIDVLQAFSPTAAAQGSKVSSGGGKLPKVAVAPITGTPAIAVPSAKPPASLTISTLIKGTGAPLQAGQTAVVKYVASNWRTGKVFNSDWPSAGQQRPPTPFSFRLASGSVIDGWVKGLAGVQVGSRVMLVIPPSLGYKKAGNPQAGIKGTDTLVFVIDVLASVTVPLH
jgi:FKBP-type peptidyl-prolyl cis-trans isomerase